MKKKVTFRDVAEWTAALVILANQGCGNCEDCKSRRAMLTGLYEVLRLCPQFYYPLRTLMEIPSFPEAVLDNAIDMLNLILETIAGDAAAGRIINLYEAAGPLSVLTVNEEVASKVELELPPDAVEDMMDGVIMAPMAEA